MPKAQQEALSIEMIGRFPEWWPIKTLSQVCKQVTDGTHDSPKPTEKGFPLVTGKAIKNRRIDFTNTYKIADADHRKVIARSKPERNDILFANIGNSIGDLVRVDTDCEFSIKNVALFKPDQSIIVPKFLEYYLFSSSVQAFVKGSTRGSAQPFIGLSSLRGFPVPVPPFEEQLYIGKILGDLDDKIQLNHQINQTLEQIAQAIFKSWFVDFEPVKAKIAALEAGGSEEDALLAAMRVIAGDAQESAHAAEGAMPEAAKGDKLTRLQTEQPEQYAQLRATAELFPSAMQESKLGEIPEGWAARDLKSSTTEIRRGISPKYTENGGIQVLNQKCIRSHKINFVLARRNDSSKRKIDGREIQIGDVLVNSTGVGTLGRLAPVRFLPEPSVTDSHVTVVRANTRLISKAFLAGLMLSSEPFIEASGAGSTGQTELRKQVLEDIMFAMPSLELSATYETIVSPMGQQIACLEEQLTSLARTRDSLLPKLLSGELSVSETESGPTGSEETANV
jgi:type I restriction enzyme S subunit